MKQRKKRKKPARTQPQGTYRKPAEEYSNPREQHAHTEYNILCVENQELRTSVDSKVNRFHSTLTNMSGPLRNFLTFEGQPRVSIDIANSQPYLANILLQPAFYQESTSSTHKAEVENQGGEEQGQEKKAEKG
ncbi:hypothetical protein [Hymenobacter roseosalivarius]|uniref:hypothetical protein n=1 Tax=Hymenobacter roseosalivarius TaxID=89967 RepID=UPI001179C78B|nr:hypothetical protein [Hymenobacter roseosalivarius]